MRFTLQNLGRLEEATIDPSKDLIVLTGHNNTSKTYVAHSIYGLCKRIDSILRKIISVVSCPSSEASSSTLSSIRPREGLS